MCEQETRGATVPAGILFTLLQFRLNLIECKQRDSALVGAKSYESTELDNSFHLAGKNNYDLSDKNRGTGGQKIDLVGVYWAQLCLTQSVPNLRIFYAFQVNFICCP